MPNTKLNDMKTIKFSPENHLLFFAGKIAIDLYHINAYKMLQGKGRSKIQDF